MSNIKVPTPDTAHIVKVTTDGYGDATISSENEIACAFFQDFSREQSGNQEFTQSDAYAYLDVDNTFIVSKGYKLQGLYFKITPFGEEQWYIISSVEVAQRKLLTNEVNNVLVQLEVAAKPLEA
tara:strand:- start:2710 stop:3081 length:372 start_codon:yes stop_codon:yes gene_type:complete